MKWRNALLSGGAALGAAAAFNAVVTRSVEPLENPHGGDDGWFEWRGHQVAYTRHGHGSPVVLLHSIHLAAWSYEWRHNVAALARNHTVYTLDLLGFGRSDRPNARYTARFYMRLIADFAARVVGGPCVLVGAGLSAAYAIVLAARDPGRFPSLVLVEPTGLLRLSEHPPAVGELTRLAFDAPVVGTAMFNTLVSRRAIRALLERLYADNDRVTEALVDVYYAAAHQPGARYAPSALLGEQLNVDVRQALRRLPQPVLLVWGEQATEAPVEEVRAFTVLKPGLEVTILDPAGDLPHDECPDDFNEAVTGFLARVDQDVHFTPGR